MSVDWVGYGYAALVASGGVIGYVKAGQCWNVVVPQIFIRHNCSEVTKTLLSTATTIMFNYIALYSYKPLVN